MSSLLTLLALQTLAPSGLGLAPQPAHAAGKDGGWEKINEDSGIVVSRREVEGSPLVAFKGVAEVDASLERILWVLVDNDYRKDWVDRLLVSTRLEKINEHEFIVYQVFDVPIGMSKRDFVYRGKAVFKPATGQVVLDLFSVKHRKAPKTVGVRAKLINSRYVLTPTGNGSKTRIEVEIHTDPKGWVPKWVVNLIQKSWPVKTLKGIRRQVDKPFAKDYPLPPAG